MPASTSASRSVSGRSSEARIAPSRKPTQPRSDPDVGALGVEADGLGDQLDPGPAVASIRSKTSRKPAAAGHQRPIAGGVRDGVVEVGADGMAEPVLRGQVAGAPRVRPESRRAGARAPRGRGPSWSRSTGRRARGTPRRRWRRRRRRRRRSRWPGSDRARRRGAARAAPALSRLSAGVQVPESTESMVPEPMAAIELQGVVKTFGKIRAVDGLDLNVDAGVCLGLLGPNGAGKSTTMRLLTGQAIADEGSAPGARLRAAEASRRRPAPRWASSRSSTTSTSTSPSRRT